MNSEEREVMELALDALTATMTTHGFRDAIDESREKAITAIKEALMSLQDGAQQSNEQGCEHCNHSLYCGTKCKNCGKQSNEQVEPAFWYSAQEDEFMTHKIRKEHERLNSYTHKVGKFDLPLYTHPAVPYVTESRTAQPKEPEQEPVGLIAIGTNKHPYAVLNKCYDKNGDCWIGGELLYTTPPQRKPLTDEQIWKNDAIMSANSGYGATFETLREVVRAIEAAHGIKE